VDHTSFVHPLKVACARGPGTSRGCGCAYDSLPITTWQHWKAWQHNYTCIPFFADDFTTSTPKLTTTIDHDATKTTVTTKTKATTSTVTTSTQTTMTGTTSTIFNPNNVDCVESMNECTVACEEKDKRNYTLTVAAVFKGRACKGAVDCKPGEDECPASTKTTTTITTTTTTTINGVEATEGKKKGKAAIGFFVTAFVLAVLYSMHRCIRCKRTRNTNYTQERFLNPLAAEGSDAYSANAMYAGNDSFGEDAGEEVFTRTGGASSSSA
jgi:hypothetical protein